MAFADRVSLVKGIKTQTNVVTQHINTLAKLKERERGAISSAAVRVVFVASFLFFLLPFCYIRPTRIEIYLRDLTVT